MGALLVVTGRERLSPTRVLALVALLLSALPWLGAKYAPLAALVALYVLWRAEPRGRAVLVAGGTLSALCYAAFHLATYESLTPYNGNLVYAGGSTATIVGEHVEIGDRVHRLWGLLIDRRFGVARWEPLLLAVVPGSVLLARGDPRLRLVLGLVAAQVLIATFVVITMMGWWFPGRTLVTVFPLLPIPLLLVASRSGRVWRTALVALGVYSLAVTAALALGGIALAAWAAWALWGWRPRVGRRGPPPPSDQSRAVRRPFEQPQLLQRLAIDVRGSRSAPVLPPVAAPRAGYPRIRAAPARCAARSRRSACSRSSCAARSSSRYPCHRCRLCRSGARTAHPMPHIRLLHRLEDCHRRAEVAGAGAGRGDVLGQALAAVHVLDDLGDRRRNAEVAESRAVRPLVERLHLGRGGLVAAVDQEAAVTRIAQRMVVGLACVLGDEDERLAGLRDQALRRPDGDCAVTDDRGVRVREVHDFLDDRGVARPGRERGRRYTDDHEVGVAQVVGGAETEWWVVEHARVDLR